MIAVCVIKDGKIDIVENISKDRFSFHKNSINIVASSKQDVVMTTQEGEKTDVFLLCSKTIQISDGLSLFDLIEPLRQIQQMLIELVQGFLNYETQLVKQINPVLLFQSIRGYTSVTSNA